ncbi:MAG: hypothetical protein P4L68_04615 [Methylovirgula sp.]|nr:hypothetical protein [Methylovirgula sp.]
MLTIIIPASLSIARRYAFESQAMAIDRLLNNIKLDAQRKALVLRAYDEALSTARIKDRSDPRTALIASRVVHAIQNGETRIWHIVSFAVSGLR